MSESLSNDSRASKSKGAVKMNAREFESRKEAVEFAKAIEKNYIHIKYRITANYPLTLVSGKVKTDRTQKPKSYTLLWN
jgi:hypothetical protein